MQFYSWMMIVIAAAARWTIIPQHHFRRHIMLFSWFVHEFLFGLCDVL